MKKISTLVIVAAVLTMASTSGYAGKKEAHPACKGKKGTELADCIKAEKAKAETKKAPADAGK